MAGNAMEGYPMLAEKFFLILETVISHFTDTGTATHPDGGPKVVSRARFIPIKLPRKLDSHGGRLS
jgi:hypothetical protein